MKAFRLSMWCTMMVMLASTSARAQHEGDVILTVENGSIRTGAEENGQHIANVRLFAGTFPLSEPFFTDEPGFDCDPGTFTPNTRIGFRIMDALREWNGSDFSGIPDETLRISFTNQLVRITPAAPEAVEGFTLSVGSNGQWHRHLSFELNPPAEVGIYLLSLTLFSTDPGVGGSDAFYILFNRGESAERLASAGQWVLQNLITPPCNADYNQDGGADNSDILELANDIAAGTSSYPPNSPDFNRDGSSDTSDVLDLANVIAGGSCP